MKQNTKVLVIIVVTSLVTFALTAIASSLAAIAEGLGIHLGFGTESLMYIAAFFLLVGVVFLLILIISLFINRKTHE